MSRKFPTASLEVLGRGVVVTALERWPESSGRGLGRLSARGIFLSSLVVFCVSGASRGGSRRRQSVCLEVSGEGKPLQNGGLRALEEAWDNSLLEAFFCQVWLFSVLLGRLWVAPGGVDLRSWR